MKKTIPIILTILVLVVGGGWAWAAINGDDENLNQTAQQNQDTDENTQNPDTENLTIDDGSETPEAETESTNLVAVGGYEGSGTATRQIANADVFNHTIKAEIQPPAEGKFYEGWLVSSSGFISTGKLLAGENNEWMLEFEDNKDLSDYTQVVVTEETLADGLDNKPEAHVLEGEF